MPCSAKNSSEMARNSSEMARNSSEMARNSSEMARRSSEHGYIKNIDWISNKTYIIMIYLQNCMYKDSACRFA